MGPLAVSLSLSLSPFPSIYLVLGSPTVLYLLTQLKKQSVDRLRLAFFFADAATEERKDIVLCRREWGKEWVGKGCRSLIRQ